VVIINLNPEFGQRPFPVSSEEDLYLVVGTEGVDGGKLCGVVQTVRGVRNTEKGVSDVKQCGIATSRVGDLTGTLLDRDLFLQHNLSCIVSGVGAEGDGVLHGRLPVGLVDNNDAPLQGEVCPQGTVIVFGQVLKRAGVKPWWCSTEVAHVYLASNRFVT